MWQFEQKTEMGKAMGDKKTQSKWFVVATEGATTDGRTINRTWIEQMAKNYNPKTYGARINLEHYKRCCCCHLQYINLGMSFC